MIDDGTAWKTCTAHTHTHDNNVAVHQANDDSTAISDPTSCCQLMQLEQGTATIQVQLSYGALMAIGGHFRVRSTIISTRMVLFSVTLNVSVFILCTAITLYKLHNLQFSRRLQ